MTRTAAKETRNAADQAAIGATSILCAPGKVTTAALPVQGRAKEACNGQSQGQSAGAEAEDACTLVHSGRFDCRSARPLRARRCTSGTTQTRPPGRVDVDRDQHVVARGGPRPRVDQRLPVPGARLRPTRARKLERERDDRRGVGMDASEAHASAGRGRDAPVNSEIKVRI